MRASRSAVASARSGTARSAVIASASRGRAGQHQCGDHPLLGRGGQIGQAPPGLLGHLLPAALFVSEQGFGDLVERQGLRGGVPGRRRSVSRTASSACAWIVSTGSSALAVLPVTVTAGRSGGGVRRAAA